VKSFRCSQGFVTSVGCVNLVRARLPRRIEGTKHDGCSNIDLPYTYNRSNINEHTRSTDLLPISGSASQLFAPHQTHPSDCVKTDLWSKVPWYQAVCSLNTLTTSRHLSAACQGYCQHPEASRLALPPYPCQRHYAGPPVTDHAPPCAPPSLEFCRHR